MLAAFSMVISITKKLFVNKNLNISHSHTPFRNDSSMVFNRALENRAGNLTIDSCKKRKPKSFASAFFLVLLWLNAQDSEGHTFIIKPSQDERKNDFDTFLF